jgi:ribonuclease E
VIDDADLEKKLRSYIRQTTPDLDHRLELYDGTLPIFEQYRVAEQIRKSLERKVWLPSGGHIVIDRTEAMTVIDVNTGKFIGKSSLEETVLQANKEAAVEVARQLRLRDIGGIIVIDFIDMEIPANRDEVIKIFRAELERDRTRTQVFDISPLGLVQMTRKNVSAGIVEAFSEPCPTCEGRGLVIHGVD